MDMAASDSPVPPTTDTPRGWMRTAAFALSAALGLAAVWAGGQHALPPPPEDPPVAGLHVEQDHVVIKEGAPPWRLLKVVPAASATAHWTEPAPARVRIDERLASRVGVPLEGRITHVDVELGERVAAGHPLFAVASPSLAELNAAAEKAELDVATARQSLDRVREMVAAHALPAKEEIAAQQGLKQAELQHRLALMKLESLRVFAKAGNEFTVRAPRSGVVVEKRILYGQEVSQGMTDPLIVIAELGTVWVMVELFEGDMPSIREGAVAEVTAPSAPGWVGQGKVEMVSAVVDPERHTIPVRVRLANTDGMLRPNMYARVRFKADHPAGTVEIASSALVSDGEHQYVWLQEPDGRFARRAVTAGSVSEDRVPIHAGLAAGERVVEEGALLLDNQLQLSR